MSKVSKISQTNKFIIICLVIGIGLGLVSFLNTMMPGSRNSAKQDAAEMAKRKQELVNKYLSSTVSSIDQNRSAVANEIDRSKNLKPAENVYHRQETFISPQTNFETAKPNAVYVKPESPSEVIQMELYKQKMQDAANEAYKQEYARQFKENALRNGYEIELDGNLEVISVKPLRQPSSSQPSEFDYE